MPVKKRGKGFHLQLRIFGKQCMVKTPAQLQNKAKHIESSILVAVDSGDYSFLDAESRATCMRLFKNQGWAIPPDLSPQDAVNEELTFWKAVETFLNYPTVKGAPSTERALYSLKNLVNYFGKDKPVKTIWIPDIRLYQQSRLLDGVRPATVNREISTLSKMFKVLLELQQVDSNPARMIEKLSTKCGEREVYISHQDLLQIIADRPEWFRNFILTLYYTGMRRSEAFELTRKRVNLEKRIIYLGPENTKEGNWKRVPIHRDLFPILQDSMKVASLDTDRIFLLKDCKGVRPPSKASIKNPWQRAVRKMAFENKPRIHDLRHTWRTNARRSGIDAQIAESIMGHWYKQKSVNDRYGRISDSELISAIDKMTFDHGESEIWVARFEKCDQDVIKRTTREKRSCGNMT